MTSKTLRLNMPQWQGGNNPAYFFGSKLLSWLAPKSTGPEVTIPVADPADGAELENENGIVGRSIVVAQAKAARAAIDEASPDRIVALGGDCLIDLAPIAYLNEKYEGKLGVLWIDSHPDVIGPEFFAHAHAHVLGALLGVGDPDLDAEVPHKLDPKRVLYAGLNEWSEPEAEIIGKLGLRNVTAAEAGVSSDKILNWIKEEGITHLAVHLDLDVLDPATFSPLLFNCPDVPAGAFEGIPQGKMALDDVMRLLKDTAAACDMVGIAITEHLPWDMIRLRDALAEMPLLKY